MTVAAAETVVRWAVMVAALACVCGAQQDGTVVDIGRCRNGCSAVPEDLWPSCCEVHNTCCEEFADSCMHDCLPRVHTGDVSAVEERPGMCCALYNLCCFRETFRISSKSHSQDPISFPIVHRFHVPPPTLKEAMNPAPRPAFRAPAQATVDEDQDFSPAPKRPSLSRPQLPKKTFRPERPQSFKKPQGPDEGPSSALNRPDDDKDKPKPRPKFGFLANRKDAEERRKLGSQGTQASEVKVTRRPATADIRQEVVTPTVMQAEAHGPRRLDASINPMVTRKRMRAPGETRQDVDGVRVRKIEVTPAREGRTLGAGRSATRPSVQETASRAQSAAVAGQENPRPATRRPSQTPPTPVIEATPKVTVEEKPRAPAAAPKTPETMKESESPVLTEEATSPVESMIKAISQAQEADAAVESMPEKSAMPEADQADEATQQEGGMMEKMEPAGEKEKETMPEMMKDEKSEPETPEKAAFTPPEIDVNIPKEPKAVSVATAAAAVPEEPARIRGSSRSSARGQPSTTEAAETQARSRSRGSSRGRGTSARGTASSQPEAESTVGTRRSRTRG